MNYGYIRVSTDKQTVENQRFEITTFAKKRGLKIDKWIEETISATKSMHQRTFGTLLHDMGKGDLMVVTELSRIGRNLMQVMGILHICMEKDIRVLSVKEGYELGDNISSKVLAFAFSLSAEIERNLISQRTKEALARKRSEGVILGRPRGRKSMRSILTGKDEQIRQLLAKEIGYSGIARILDVHRVTVSTYVAEKGLRG